MPLTTVLKRMVDHLIIAEVTIGIFAYEPCIAPVLDYGQIWHLFFYDYANKKDLTPNTHSPFT